jgi:hypothetical protein
MIATSDSRWICNRCAVSVGRIDGVPAARPDTWTESEAGIFCLGCSRALAGEAAIDTAPEDCSTEDRARLRRSAVIEFEVRRAPDSPDRQIAQACRTSASAVKAVRYRIEKDQEAAAWR